MATEEVHDATQRVLSPMEASFIPKIREFQGQFWTDAIRYINEDQFDKLEELCTEALRCVAIYSELKAPINVLRTIAILTKNSTIDVDKHLLDDARETVYNAFNAHLQNVDQESVA